MNFDVQLLFGERQVKKKNKKTPQTFCISIKQFAMCNCVFKSSEKVKWSLPVKVILGSSWNFCPKPNHFMTIAAYNSKSICPACKKNSRLSCCRLSCLNEPLTLSWYASCTVMTKGFYTFFFPLAVCSNIVKTAKVISKVGSETPRPDIAPVIASMGRSWQLVPTASIMKCTPDPREGIYVMSCERVCASAGETMSSQNKYHNIWWLDGDGMNKQVRPHVWLGMPREVPLTADKKENRVK